MDAGDADIGQPIDRGTEQLGAAGRESVDRRIEAVNPGDLFTLIYTSGTTGDPKGVQLTHANMMSNIRAIIGALEFTEADRGFSWMPLTHDMGLIGYHISMLAANMEHALMDTALFVRRPLLWLQKASELRSTVLCSPNFGYKHYLKVFERKGAGEVDLSGVRLLLNGAEPISVGLCEEFLSAMAPHGPSPVIPPFRNAWYGSVGRPNVSASAIPHDRCGVRTPSYSTNAVSRARATRGSSMRVS